MGKILPQERYILLQKLILSMTRVRGFCRGCLGVTFYLKGNSIWLQKLILSIKIISGGQCMTNPQGYMGKGMKGKGQGQDFHTLAKPLTLGEGKGFGGSGSG